MSDQTYYCRTCRAPVSWEAIVTTETGTFHEVGPAQHPVEVVDNVDVAEFFDDGMLWLSMLEAFTEGRDAGGLLRELSETMTTSDLTKLQIKGGYNVGALMLHLIAGIAGITIADAAGLVRGFMLEQRMEADR